MILSEFLGLKELPESLSGPLTAPSARVRMLHALPCPGSPGDVPEVFHLTGCVLCGNTADVAFLDRRIKAAEGHLHTLALNIRKAPLEGNGPYGKEYSLASLRVSDDPEWGVTAEDDEPWEESPEGAAQVAALVEELADAHKSKLFRTGEYARTVPSRELVLVSPYLLVNTAADLVLSQVPLRVDVVAGDVKALVSVPPSRRDQLVERHRRRAALPPVFPTSRSGSQLSSPEYSDTWRLAMEILGSQIEERERARDGRKVDLDAVLDAAEAALA